MDDKVMAALISTLCSGMVYGITALIRHGKQSQKFETIEAIVTALQTDHVKKTEYENELLAVHGRIDRHSKESEERSRELQALLSNLGRDMAEIKGFMRGKFGQHEGD